MKHRITPFLAFVLLIATATAQGEWKWAHYWTGQDGTTTSTSYHNYISNSAFDDEGNLYVYAAMGDNPVMDGEPFEFCLEAMYGGQNNPAILLAKFDTLGNMLWYKVVKQSSCAAIPHWMEVKEDRVCIAGSAGFLGDGLSQWLYFLDTLITKAQINALPIEQHKPPFKTYSQWTFFAQFDFDGNLLDCHFVEAFPRDFYPANAMSFPLYNGTGIAPFHKDYEENTYFFAPIQYGGNVDDPYTLVVDGDTNRTYNLFLPGGTDNFMGIKNALFYKFTPDWTLDFAHLLVDHTDGIATPPEFSIDTINPDFYINFKGLSFDEHDNMYLSGQINLGLYSPNYGGNLHNYPVHFWWDTSNYMIVNDISGAIMSNFIVKYNPEGQVIWDNQINTRAAFDPNNPESSARAFWYGNVFDNNSVYIVGVGGYGSDALVYFDGEDDYLQSTIGTNKDIAFFARYDAVTGNYLNQGVVPGVETLFDGKTSQPCAIGNKVIAMVAQEPQNNSLVVWGNDGTILYRDEITSVQRARTTSVCTSIDGVFASCLTTLSPVNFGNGVSVNCSTERSSAVVALKHDPELLVPYVKVPEYTGAKPEVRLWPNPATDRITIESEADFPIKSIAITDMQGQLITVLPGSDVRHTLNIHKLPAGTYIAHIETKAGISDVKFVKAE